MTADMVCRRLAQTFADDRVIVPGRCCGDLTSIEGRFGVPVGRGPEERKDLPEFFGAAAYRSPVQHAREC